MVQNLRLNHFMPQIAVYTKLHVSKAHSKTLLWKGNINTYLALQVLSFFHANLPKCFWSYAIIHFAFLINHLLTKVLKNLSPYEVLHGKSPDLIHIKVFGSFCFAFTLCRHCTKLDLRACKCIYWGLESGIKGYVRFDLASREIFISRDIRFYELHLPFHQTSHNLDPAPPQTPFSYAYHPDTYGLQSPSSSITYYRCRSTWPCPRPLDTNRAPLQPTRH